MTTITLSNQASFADFFRQFAAGDITNDVVIKFKQPKAMQETPFLLIGDAEHDGTINASVMRALLVHQTNINRLYSLIVYGKVQRLKVADAEALKIKFRIRKGSLEAYIANIDIVLPLILSNLKGRQITAIAVAGLFFYFSSGVIINYTNEYFDFKKTQIEQEYDLKKRRMEQEHDLKKTQIEQEHDLKKTQIEQEHELKKRRMEQEHELEKRRMEHKFILDTIKELKDGDKITKGGQDFLNELKKLERQGNTVTYLGHKISSNTKNIIPKK